MCELEARRQVAFPPPPTFLHQSDYEQQQQWYGITRHSTVKKRGLRAATQRHDMVPHDRLGPVYGSETLRQGLEEKTVFVG